MINPPETEFWQEFKNGNVLYIRNYLNSNLEILYENYGLYGSILLHIASLNNLLSIAELLLNSGIFQNLSTVHSGDTPLHSAVRNGNLDMVILLINYGGNPNICNNESQTPMTLSLKLNNTYIFDYFLSLNVDLNIFTGQGTILHYASEIGNESAVKKLLAKGVNLEIKNHYGLTPLHFACWRAKENIVELLLDNDASPYTKDKDGSTPLMYAAAYNQPNIVRLLLTKMDDISQTNNLGHTAIDYSQMNGSLATEELLFQKEEALLIAEGYTSSEVESLSGDEFYYD